MIRLRVMLWILAAGCTSARASSSPTPSSGSFRAAILGDMPYQTPNDPKRDSIMAAYHAVLDTIARENVAFVVHIGDITGATCSDSLYAVRLREFSAMPHPFIYTFGDNEWTDCARDGKDPVERLAKLREVFTQGNTSLGQRVVPLERQSAQPAYAKYRENVRWTVGDVVFLGSRCSCRRTRASTRLPDDGRRGPNLTDSPISWVSFSDSRWRSGSPWRSCMVTRTTSAWINRSRTVPLDS